MGKAAQARQEQHDELGDARPLAAERQTAPETAPAPGAGPAAEPVDARDDLPVFRRPARRAAYVGNGVYARPRRGGWRRWSRVLGMLLLVAVVLGGVRAAAVFVASDNQVIVYAQNQQAARVDLATAVPRSPYIFGMNVFPATGTQAQDGAYGFMPYDARTLAGLTSAGVTMLRFPGGNWGEEHSASYEQINAFLQVAEQTHATPLMQVRLHGNTPEAAAALVHYTNNPHDPVRQQRYPNAPFLPVHYWVIGNEPDLFGGGYGVNQYVSDFIAFARAMKTADPAIQILGPEISQYNGPNAAPRDDTGTPWLEGFLRGVAAYERAHGVRLLDGVTVHRYPFTTTATSDSLLLASASEWRYALPLLRDEVRQMMGRDLPVGITEINTNALGGAAPPAGPAALWWAETLGTLIEGQATYVDFFAARGIEHPQALLAMDGQPTPFARVMELYRNMAPDAIAVNGAASPLALFAATNQAHDRLTLMLINTSADPVTALIAPQRAFSGWSRQEVTVAPYAITCVVLRHGAGGLAYSYAPGAGVNGQAGQIQRQTLPR